jgi:origin recognition complex subunit 5
VSSELETNLIQILVRISGFGMLSSGWPLLRLRFICHHCLPMDPFQPQTAVDGYVEATSQLIDLLSTYPPPFIYVHDPSAPRIATSSIISALANLTESSGDTFAYAHVNAISCFTSRLLYDTVLNALANWSADWEDGCANWVGGLEGTGQRFNENFDGFTHGLRAIRSELVARKGKGKEKATANDSHELRLVLVIECAERLKETMPELIAPLTRLAELVSYITF